jgi:general secretion pathway protein D
MGPAPLGRHARRIVGIAAVLFAPGLSAQQPGVQPTDKGVLVDFQDADLRFVITALAEAGNINVSYGDLPAKRITLHMRTPVPRDQIRPLLEGLAKSNGLLVSDDGGLLRLESPAPVTAAAATGQSRARDGETRPELRLFVYRLEHARAAKLASTLQTIFGGARAQTASPGLSTVPLSERLREGRYQPLDTTRRVQVSVDSAPAATPSLPGQLQGDVLIVPDEGTNSLLVRATPDDWAVVRQAIQAMDLRPLQVLIEVLIAEVQRTSDLNVSVGGVVQKAGGDSLTGTGGSLKGATNDFVLRLVQSGKWNVDVALSALASRGRVRILSRPVVLAQNNQEAKILVGSERPFIQVSRSLPTDAAVRDQVIQYRDVGTSLSILPTINPDGYVNLQVVQQVSTATNEVQFGAPVISTREASTHLFVKDGQTAVIGGLVDRQQDYTRSGIPGLMSIPLIGALFGSTTRTTSNSELFLFLTPHIVQSDADMDRVRDGIENGTELLKRELPIPRPLVPNRPSGAEPPSGAPNRP